MKKMRGFYGVSAIAIASMLMTCPAMAAEMDETVVMETAETVPETEDETVLQAESETEAEVIRDVIGGENGFWYRTNTAVVFFQGEDAINTIRESSDKSQAIRDLLTEEEAAIWDAYCKLVEKNELIQVEGYENVWAIVRLNDGVDITEVIDQLKQISLFKDVELEYVSMPEDPGIPELDTTIEALHVNLLYIYVLNREADASGKRGWVEQMTDYGMLWQDVVRGFYESGEFKERNLSDEEYLDTLYQSLLYRAINQEEKDSLLAELSSGSSRESVLENLLASDEFIETVHKEGLDKAPVEAFVKRLYAIALNRGLEEEGKQTWQTGLMNGELGARDVVRGVIFSNEFQEKGLSDEDYIKCLYQIVLNRDPEEGGMNTWMEVLSNENGREAVFKGIMYSSEFSEWCQRSHVSEEATPIIGCDSEETE